VWARQHIDALTAAGQVFLRASEISRLPKSIQRSPRVTHRLATHVVVLPVDSVPAKLGCTGEQAARHRNAIIRERCVQDSGVGSAESRTSLVCLCPTNSPRSLLNGSSPALSLDRHLPPSAMTESSIADSTANRSYPRSTHDNAAGRTQ
jgi:hypothetical protein